jgi:Schlafen, AlbA_2
MRASMHENLYRVDLQSISGSDLYAGVLGFTRVAEPIENRPVEGYVLDFKEDWNDSALKTIAAFANTFGGLLILGVSETGGRPDKFVGIESARELKTRIAGSIATSLYPSPMFEIGECLLESERSRRMCVIGVHETTRVCLITKKGISANPIYVRNEDRSEPADAGQVRVLLERKAAVKVGLGAKRLGENFLITEFFITRKAETEQRLRSDTYFRLIAEPSTAQSIRLDLSTEMVFRDAVFRNFRGIESRTDLVAEVDRSSDWFEIIAIDTAMDHQMRWRITSNSDVAFITQVADGSDQQLWSL